MEITREEIIETIVKRITTEEYLGGGGGGAGVGQYRRVVSAEKLAALLLDSGTIKMFAGSCGMLGCDSMGSHTHATGGVGIN